MDGQNCSVPGIIPSAFFDVIELLERDRRQFAWKIQRNKDGLSLFVRTIPAKSQNSRMKGCIPGKGSFATPTETVLTAEVPSKREPRKKKSPSTKARDRERRKRFRRLRKAKQASRPGDVPPASPVLQQSQQGESGILHIHTLPEKTSQTEVVDQELPDGVGQDPKLPDPEPGHPVSEPDHTSECDDIDSVGCNSEMESDTSDFQMNSPELRVLKQFAQTAQLDSDDDNSTSDNEQDLFCFCSNCSKRGAETDLKRCSECKLVKYCSRNCQVAHWPMHKLGCKSLQGLKSK